MPGTLITGRPDGRPVYLEQGTGVEPARKTAKRPDNWSLLILRVKFRVKSKTRRICSKWYRYRAALRPENNGSGTASQDAGNSPLRF